MPKVSYICRKTCHFSLANCSQNCVAACLRHRCGEVGSYVYSDFQSSTTGTSRSQSTAYAYRALGVTPIPRMIFCTFTQNIMSDLVRISHDNGVLSMIGIWCKVTPPCSSWVTVVALVLRASHIGDFNNRVLTTSW